MVKGTSLSRSWIVWMTSRFWLTNNRLRLCLGAILPAAVVVLLLVAHWAPVHAQSAEQLTVYSPQTTYAASMLDIQGHPYVGLIELLEPLGSVEGKVDGKKYKLRFTPPGGHTVEAQFNEGKDKSKILGENFKLPGNFAQQNGRGYVPLAAVPEILSKLLAKPIQLHASSRRLFIGDVAMRYSLVAGQEHSAQADHQLSGGRESVDRDRARSPASYLPARAHRLQRAGQLQLYRLQHHRRGLRRARRLGRAGHHGERPDDGKLRRRR